MRRIGCLVALAVCHLLHATAARSEADGPDRWAVKGVARGGNLTIRAQPSASARAIGAIPYNARGLKNLGCRGVPTFAEWS